MKFLLVAISFVALVAWFDHSNASRAALATAVVADEDAGRLMHAIGNLFRETEAAIAAHDAALLVDKASQLGRECQDVGSVRPGANTQLADVFAEYAHALAPLAAEVEAGARSGDLVRAAQSFERLRTNCVACHIRFRADNGEHGLFPATNNTLTGRTSIRTLDGKQREDKSNVLIFVEGVPLESAPSARAPSQKISQVDRKFVPRVLPIVRGTTVEFPNDDFIYHNVFSLSEIQPFDLGAYGPGQSKSVLFSRSGLARVYCNIHPDMVATIVILDNPCFGLTDRTGFFVVTGIPDGKYAVRAWHEYGGDFDESVTFEHSSMRTLTIQLNEKRATLEHKNKFGKPYRGDYR